MQILSRVSVTALVIACAAAACHKAEEAPPEGKQPTVSAKVVVVTPQSFTETLDAIGTVTPRVGHVATLSAPAAGRVGRVLVETGRAVTAGQTLIELDQEPFRASLEAAQVTYDAAQRANERQQRLAREGIAPRKDAEQAAADLARARNELAVARRAESLATIRSPIAGVVTRVATTIGSSVDPSQPLIEIADPATLDIVLSVTPADAARVRRGARTTLTAGQSPSGDTIGVATVVDVARTIDSTTRSVAVRAQVAMTRRALRIGETVFGSIAIATRRAAIVVPNEALVSEGDAYTVFVVDANDVAHARRVTVGNRSATAAVIVEGLKAGERIVTFGAYGMEDGAKVVPLAPLTDSARAEKP